jgi:hypothetical protein
MGLSLAKHAHTPNCAMLRCVLSIASPTCLPPKFLDYSWASLGKQAAYPEMSNVKIRPLHPPLNICHEHCQSSSAFGDAAEISIEQRSRRPIFNPPGPASWPFFLRHGGSTRMIRRWTLRYRQSGSDRLEKRPTDFSKMHLISGNRTLGGSCAQGEVSRCEVIKVILRRS